MSNDSVRVCVRVRPWETKRGKKRTVDYPVRVCALRLACAAERRRPLQDDENNACIVDMDPSTQQTFIRPKASTHPRNGPGVVKFDLDKRCAPGGRGGR
jgi:hypothetical protein